MIYIGNIALRIAKSAGYLGTAGDGDVTMVEFFDYNCPYCKSAANEVKALMAEDSNIRVVYRE